MRLQIEQQISSGQNITDRFLTERCPKLWAWCKRQTGDPRMHLYLELYLSGERPRCTCGNVTRFIQFRSGFMEFCSHLCATRSDRATERRKQTYLERYGVDCGAKVPSIRSKFKRTMRRRHGVTYAGQSPQALKKRSRTLVQKYGSVKEAYQHVRSQAESTMLERYGVTSVLQLREFHERQQQSGFKMREFTLDGKTFRVRGYEEHAIRYLHQQGIPVTKILTTAAEGVPSVPWIDSEGVNHIYHPDIYAKLAGKWTLLEVKSTYTLGLRDNRAGLFSRVQRKARASLDAGYRFKVLLVHRRGRVDVIDDIQEKRRIEVKVELGLVRRSVALEPRRKLAA